MTIDYTHFKAKLEEEKQLLESEMKNIGQRDPENPSDWEAKPEEKDVSTADENTVADAIEEYDDNIAIMGTLEARYKDVLKILEKMTNDSYGICEVCGQEIEADRLEANPSASTCKAHM